MRHTVSETLSAVLFGLVCASPALADEAELWLELERGKVAMREGRPDDAREHAIAAMGAADSWQAPMLYLDACDASGLFDACMGGFEGIGAGDAEVDTLWKWARVTRGLDNIDVLRELADSELATRGLAQLALAEKPDLTLALLSDADAAEDLALVMRAHLALEQDKEAVAAAKRLQQAAPEDVHLLAALWSEGADAGPVAKQRKRILKALPGTLPDEIDPVPVYRVLTVAISAHDKELAAAAADKLEALGESRPLARHVYNAAMRHDMARGLAMSRNPKLPPGTTMELSEITIAVAENLRDLGRVEEAVTLFENTRQEHDNAGLAIEHANLLLRMGRVKDAKSVAKDAVYLASRAPSHDIGFLSTDRDEQLATAWAVLAYVHSARGEVPEALVAVTTATTLHPHADWFYLRGQLQAKVTDYDAAFVSFAIAEALGSLGAKASLGSVFRGVGDPGDAAFAIVNQWSHDRPDAAVSVALEEAIDKRGQERKEQPRIGKAMPEWELMVDGAPLRSSELEGQVIVLTFWASWCAPCQQELPALAKVARRLQKNGTPATVVAVSVDSRERDFQRWKPQGDVSGLRIAWSPEMGQDWKISALPTLWIVDSTGTNRFVHTGYRPGVEDEIEAKVLDLLPQ